MPVNIHARREPTEQDRGTGGINGTLPMGRQYTHTDNLYVGGLGTIPHETLIAGNRYFVIGQNKGLAENDLQTMSWGFGAGEVGNSINSATGVGGYYRTNSTAGLYGFGCSIGLLTQLADNDLGWANQTVSTNDGPPGGAVSSGYLQAIDLDSGLVENVDWWHAKNASFPTDIDDVYANNPATTISFTADGTSDYAIFASQKLNNTAGIPTSNTLGKIRIRNITDSLTLSTSGHGLSSVFANEQHSPFCMRVMPTPSAISRTLTVECIGGGEFDVSVGDIFILRLNAFASYAFEQDSPSAALGGAVDTYAIKESMTYTPDARGEMVYMAYSNVDINSDTDGFSQLIQKDSSTIYDPDQSGGGPDYVNASDGTGGGDTAVIQMLASDKLGGLAATPQVFDLQIAASDTSCILEETCMLAFGTVLANETETSQKIRILKSRNDIASKSGGGHTLPEAGGNNPIENGSGAYDHIGVEHRDAIAGNEHLLIYQGLHNFSNGGGGTAHMENKFMLGTQGAEVENTDFKSQVRNSSSGSTPGNQHFFMTKWTPADEQQVAQIVGSTVGFASTEAIAEAGFTSIDLNDLTEITSPTSSGDWRYAEDDVAQATMDNTYGNNAGASVTFTPVVGNDYVIMGCGVVQLTSNGTEYITRMRLQNTTGATTHSEILRATPTQAAEIQWGFSAMHPQNFPTNDQQTFRLEFQGDSQFNHVFSSIFVLRLNAFRAHAFTTTNHAGADFTGSVETVITSAALVPGTAKEALAFAYVNAENPLQTDRWNAHLDYNQRYSNNSNRVASPIQSTIDEGTSNCRGNNPAGGTPRECLFGAGVLGSRGTLANDNVELVIEPLGGAPTSNKFFHTSVVAFTTQLDPTPLKPTAPDPADTATNVSPEKVLGWMTGANTDSFDVYFGTDLTDVTNATTSDPEFKGNQVGTSFDPGTLDQLTTYYWRIDAVALPTTVAGDVWTFSTSTAISPTATPPLTTRGGTDVAGNKIETHSELALDAFIGLHDK